MPLWIANRVECRNRPPLSRPRVRSKQKGGALMSIGAWVMLVVYIVGLGGGSLALIAYSLRHNNI